MESKVDRIAVRLFWYQ